MLGSTAEGLWVASRGELCMEPMEGTCTADVRWIHVLLLSVCSLRLIRQLSAISMRQAAIVGSENAIYQSLWTTDDFYDLNQPSKMQWKSFVFFFWAMISFGVWGPL